MQFLQAYMEHLLWLCCLFWEALFYHEEIKDQGAVDDRLVLLKGVSGAFRPGVPTALLGNSGAGKTTLLDVLSGRKIGGYSDGSISISGY